jgi:pilus assembly protein Flp/PilA
VIPANTSTEQDSVMRRFTQRSQVNRFLPAQEGTTAIEYALIASGIAGVLIATITTLGGTVTDLWTAVAGMF